MYYLKHEQECFIRYKTHGAAERFVYLIKRKLIVFFIYKKPFCVMQSFVLFEVSKVLQTR